MFDIGFWELLVVGLIGLVILGPERLPRAIRSLQASLQKVRQFGSRMEAEINHELRIKELHDNLKKIEQADDIDNLPAELKHSLEQLQRAAASVNRPYAKSDDPSEPDEAPSNDAANQLDNPKSDTHQPHDNSEGRNDRTP